MLKSKIQDNIVVVDQLFTTININRQARSTVKIDLQEFINRIKNQQSIESLITELECGFDEAIKLYITKLHLATNTVFVSDNELMYRFIQELDFLDDPDMAKNYQNAYILVEKFRNNQRKYDQVLDNFIFEVKNRGTATKPNDQIL